MRRECTRIEYAVATDVKLSWALIYRCLGIDRVNWGDDHTRMFNTHAIAQRILSELSDDVRVSDPNDGFACLINHTRVIELSDDLTAVIADVVASILNAGSERDSVEENLGPHIYREVWSWCDADAPSDAAHHNH